MSPLESIHRLAESAYRKNNYIPASFEEEMEMQDYEECCRLYDGDNDFDTGDYDDEEED